MKEAKRVPAALMTAYEEAAMEGLKALREYNAYKGANPEFFRRARMNLAVITSYPKLYSAETNRMAVEMAMEAAALPAGPARKQLKGE
jgi:hypothetical protein